MRTGVGVREVAGGQMLWNVIGQGLDYGCLE